MFNLDSEWIERKNQMVGMIFENKEGYKFKVLNYYRNSIKGLKKFRIRFESGFETFTTHNHIKSGSIVDRLSPTVSSVGSIGYASFKDNQKEYHMWKAMLNRCYVESHNRYYTYGARGVKVCDRWLRFDYYLEDLPLIEGYDLELYNKGELVLDKDIKFEGNKVYSLETCMFVTVAENTVHSVKRIDGRNIKVLNLKTNDYENYPSISAFCRKYNLNRHSVVKNANTKVEYKNFLIYLEECTNV